MYHLCKDGLPFGDASYETREAALASRSASYCGPVEMTGETTFSQRGECYEIVAGENPRALRAKAKALRAEESSRAAAARQWHEGINEGGEGYNPYRADGEDRLPSYRKR